MRRATKTYFAFIACFLSILSVNAEEWKWFNPMDAGFPVVQNQGWTSEIGNTYYRLPDRAKDNVRGAVWNLSRHSAGLALHFYSNATKIKVRYTVDGPLAMYHMPATGVSGLDLYGIDQNGQWRRFFGFFNGSQHADTLVTSFINDRMKQFHSHGYEFRLYLPLYNSVKQIEIGVPVGSEFRFIPVSKEKPIIVYGTSIEQGAVASRPGMAWTTQIQRAVDYPLINLGFSGNGRLEKGILDLMSETDSRLYILACLANLCDATPDRIDSLTIAAVVNLRRNNSTPIILVEHPGFSDVPVNGSQAEIIDRLNSASKSVYKKLTEKGFENIYYVSREEMNIPADGWTDDVHPSDLGQTAMAKAIEKVVRKALGIPMGVLSTTIPVTQRREPDAYEWRERHDSIVALNHRVQPRKVIIGNSIIHYWAGEPTAYKQAGPKSWNKYMNDFVNLGCGWDRIENALWRIYHGELDGYEAEQIVIMLGTNNYTLCSDADLVEGLRNLISAVRFRQPKAEIVVAGILPRRGAVEWTMRINHLIEEMSKKENCRYINPGLNLLKADGTLDESLFSDGLHPVEDGYMMLEKLSGK